ncbi:serine protease [Bacteroidia bacterium]|nr:serine protease [Bacteroidia bacterium]
MKRIFYLLSFVAVAAISGGVTAYRVTRHASAVAAERTIVHTGSEGLGTGTHFTAYDRENYPDLTYAAENAVKAVINIEKIEEVKSRGYGRGGGYNPFFDFFGIPDQGQQQGPQSQERRSGGSGVIISADGYIVTNNHVAENASKLKVTLEDDRTFDARLVGADPTTDIALIKIDAQGLPTLPFGDSEKLRLGEWVLAIGSPFDLRSTVTAGIVSAKARNLDVIPNQFRIESFIQTDAAVNPGNSGGALVNVKGELVGINTVIKSPTGSFTGYSFAVPVSIVQKVVMDLKEYGVVQRALLGISFQEINSAFIEEYGEKYGIKETGGVRVAELDPDGAAKAAGIREGDIITAIDGVKVNGSASVLEIIAKHRPNDKVNVTAKRGDQMKQIEVVLRNRAGKAELLKKEFVDVPDALGGAYATVSDKDKKALKISGGIRVLSIEKDGILKDLGIRPGFIITAVNQRAVEKVADLSKITTAVRSIDGISQDGKERSYMIVEKEKAAVQEKSK